MISRSLAHSPTTTQGLDIGPDSIKMIQASLSDCKTVLWNGPMG